MFLKKIFIFGILFFYSIIGCAWNAVGHQLIAQIAFDYLTPRTKAQLLSYNHALDKVYKPMDFVAAATWLDKIRYQDIPWFSSLHYIDWPYPSTHTEAQSMAENNNALWAIEMALQVLHSKKARYFDKGIALRILIHVVGDVHQPLHTCTHISPDFPEGDRGGNLTLLKHNRIADNLHAYWDRGGGLLTSRTRKEGRNIKQWSKTIEHTWPCGSNDEEEINPIIWVRESHQIAIKYAYQLPITAEYQERAQQITEQQIAKAGCRLSVLLNNIG